VTCGPAVTAPDERPTVGRKRLAARGLADSEKLEPSLDVRADRSVLPETHLGTFAEAVASTHRRIRVIAHLGPQDEAGLRTTRGVDHAREVGRASWRVDRGPKRDGQADLGDVERVLDLEIDEPWNADDEPNGCIATRQGSEGSDEGSVGLD